MPDINNVYQRATPFIRPVSTTGGTTYVFPSAAEDLTLSFNTDTSTKFKFSKFALLNIPDFLTENPLLNSVRLKAIPGAYQYADFRRTTKLNHLFAESFQNYCLNLETMILSSDNYNPRISRTVSERVFFKWLKELGALRFKTKNVSNVSDLRYVEEEDSIGSYNRVVKYIGDIDFVNNLSTQVNSYSEVYIHIPTEVGDFQNVLFKSIEDDNYSHGMIFGRNSDGVNNEFISGRKYSDFNPAGLDIHGYYDNDINLPNSDVEVSGRLYNLWKKKEADKTYIVPDNYLINKWWYGHTSGNNYYYLEPLSFASALNDDLAISTGDAADPDLTAIKFRRSRLDGISIDFDVNSYKNITDIESYSLLDVAKSSNSKNFEFNAVLVYYDLYEDVAVEQPSTNFIQDSNDIIDTFTPEKTTNILSTNLFGIMFLDNVEDNLSLSGGFIPRFKKVRPNTVTKLNGNAYGLKLNLKLDVSPIDTGIEVETVISDSNTLAMDIYADTLNSIRRTTEKMEGLIMDSMFFDSRLTKFENLYTKIDENSVNSLLSRIEKVESILSSDLNISNSKSNTDVVALFEKYNKIVTDILNGKVPLNLSYDLSNFVPGDGIAIEKNSFNKLIISSQNNNYNFQEKKETSVFSDWNIQGLPQKGSSSVYYYEAELKPLKNYLRINDTQSFVPNKDMILYINDSIGWKLGQSFKVQFASDLIMKNQNGSFDLYVYTDFFNKKRSKEKYSSLVCKISSIDFQNKKFRPSFEIICKDAEKLEFFIDFLN